MSAEPQDVAIAQAMLPKPDCAAMGQVTAEDMVHELENALEAKEKVAQQVVVC